MINGKLLFGAVLLEPFIGIQSFLEVYPYDPLFHWTFCLPQYFLILICSSRSVFSKDQLGPRKVQEGKLRSILPPSISDILSYKK